MDHLAATIVATARVEDALQGLGYDGVRIGVDTEITLTAQGRDGQGVTYNHPVRLTSQGLFIQGPDGKYIPAASDNATEYLAGLLKSRLLEAQPAGTS